MPRRHVLRAQEGCRCDCMMILQPYSAFRRVRSIHIAVACVAICVQPPLCSMASFQDAYLAFGMFVRIPVRGCLLGLLLVHWGSMSLHGLCGGMCHIRYSMGGSRCAPPQRLCIPGAKLFGEGGVIALLTHRSPLNTKGDDATDRKIRNLGSGELLSELATSTSQGWGNPCWWGHALTKWQSELGVIEWGQRGGRRWPPRAQMS